MGFVGSMGSKRYRIYSGGQMCKHMDRYKHTHTHTHTHMYTYTYSHTDTYIFTHTHTHTHLHLTNGVLWIDGQREAQNRLGRADV